jgi:hypothetical protein
MIESVIRKVYTLIIRIGQRRCKRIKWKTEANFGMRICPLKKE